MKNTHTKSAFCAVWATIMKSIFFRSLEASRDVHSNGLHDLFVLNVRYQSFSGPDVDIAWHVRDFSESMVPDSRTYIGQGDLDSTSGAGNDIRFDFASMGILPDGGSFIAYQDSTDPDPLFSVELLLPPGYIAKSQTL